MNPYRNAQGNWMVPAVADDGDLIADGWVELTPAHPQYEQWRAYLAGEPDWADRVAGGGR